MHVDDFIEQNCGQDQYARWFLLLHRLPPSLFYDFEKWISQYKLFCTFENKRWRVIGASCMGDVWLTKNFNRESGYDKRVDPELCTDWSPTIEIRKEMAMPNKHGSPADRGSADYYYGRKKDPHWYPNGTNNEPRIGKENMTPQEIEEYNKAYDEETERKDWR